MPPKQEPEKPAKKVKSDGRVLFTVRTQTPKPCELTERDRYALAFIHRHTMVASNILHELMRQFRGTKDRTNYVDWLRRLYDGEWLERPMAQRYTEQPNGNFHVYALTPKAHKFLKLPEVVRHSGHFPHQLMGATFTATIDIMCRREGYRFIPAHEFLGNTKKKLEIPFAWEGKTIEGKHAVFEPDYIYAIEFEQGSYLGFVVEFNRDTEPQTSDNYFRRTDLKTIRQMERLIGRKEYKDLFGHKYPVLFQFVTVTEMHANNFIETAKREMKDPRDVFATYTPLFASPFKPPKFPSYLFDEPWLGTRNFTIKKTAS